jgi:hypothetical protein
MKTIKNKKAITRLFILLFIYLTACTPPHPLVATPIETPSLTASLIAPTVTPSLIPTSTIEPTTTFTQFPTLSPDQLDTVIIKLLKPNLQCQLNCWWGIVPGQTTWQKTQQWLSSEGIDTHYFESSIRYYYKSYVNPDRIINHFNFFTQGGVVNAIQITSQSAGDNDAFKKFWADYSPEAIIWTYGRPSHIWVDSSAYGGADGNPTVRPFTIWFVYDDLGFFTSYSGSVSYGPTYHFCPVFDRYGSDLWNLNMFLVSPKDEKTLSEATQISPGPLYHLDLEVAANVTIDEFYALYQQKNKPICIDTPRDAWK